MQYFINKIVRFETIRHRKEATSRDECKMFNQNLKEINLSKSKSFLVDRLKLKRYFNYYFSKYLQTHFSTQVLSDKFSHSFEFDVESVFIPDFIFFIL